MHSIFWLKKSKSLQLQSLKIQVVSAFKSLQIWAFFLKKEIIKSSSKNIQNPKKKIHCRIKNETKHCCKITIVEKWGWAVWITFSATALLQLLSITLQKQNMKRKIQLLFISIALYFSWSISPLDGTARKIDFLCLMLLQERCHL